MEHVIPTIKEIAKLIGVSNSTVSRALDNHPGIGLETRMRVQRIAKQMNYEPNSHAIFLKKKKSGVIGVAVPSITEDFFPEAICGIEASAIENGYAMLLGQSHDNCVNEEEIVGLMKKQRVDGLVISSSKQTNISERFKPLEK